MVATPIRAADLPGCAPARGNLGPLFTQTAVQFQGHAYTLNVDAVRAGDILLYSHVSTNRNKNPVYRYQRYLFGPEAARWTHCGIVDENLTIWDAMPSANVRSRPLREILIETHQLKLVRPCVPPDPVALRTSLLQFSNHRYGIFSVATVGRLGARLARVGTWTNPATNDGSVMCSLFVSDVLRRSTRHGFFRKLPITVPADFVTDPDFIDIPLYWCIAQP